MIDSLSDYSCFATKAVLLKELFDLSNFNHWLLLDCFLQDLFTFHASWMINRYSLANQNLILVSASPRCSASISTQSCSQCKLCVLKVYLMIGQFSNDEKRLSKSLLDVENLDESMIKLVQNLLSPNF